MTNYQQAKTELKENIMKNLAKAIVKESTLIQALTNKRNSL